MMRKCIISLLFSTIFLTLSSQSHLKAQVYNQNMDKRFDPNFKSEQAYYKYVHKFSGKLYSDYFHLLEQMIKSKVPKEMELLRIDKLRSLKELRHDINNRSDYDAKFQIKRSMNIMIDKYEDIYQNEINNIIQVYMNKESEASLILKEQTYQKQIVSSVWASIIYLSDPFNVENIKGTIQFFKQQKLENAGPQYDNIYKTDLKNLTGEFDLKLDTLPSAKEYFSEFSKLQFKASEARSTFEGAFKKFESEYNLSPEDEEDFETYTSRQIKHYKILRKLEFIEMVNVYILDLFISVHKLESIDKDFRLALEELDGEQALLIRKHMNHHANIEYTKLKKVSKFNNKEGDFRSSSIRLIKYYQSTGKNTYPKIIDFIKKNKESLVKEKQNQEEFDKMSEDKDLHKSKEAYKEYLNFPPPQKYTVKLELLINKYRERLKDSTEDFRLSLEELREMFTKDFDPLDN